MNRLGIFGLRLVSGIIFWAWDSHGYLILQGLTISLEFITGLDDLTQKEVLKQIDGSGLALRKACGLSQTLCRLMVLFSAGSSLGPGLWARG